MRVLVVTAALLLAGCQGPGEAPTADATVPEERARALGGNITFRATGMFLAGSPDAAGGTCGELWPEVMTVRFDLNLTAPRPDAEIDSLYVFARHHLDPAVVAVRTWSVLSPEGTEVARLQSAGEAMGPGASVGSGHPNIPRASLLWGQYHIEGRICAGTPHAFEFTMGAHVPPQPSST